MISTIIALAIGVASLATSGAAARQERSLDELLAMNAAAAEVLKDVRYHVRITRTPYANGAPKREFLIGEADVAIKGASFRSDQVLREENQPDQPVPAVLVSNEDYLFYWPKQSATARQFVRGEGGLLSAAGTAVGETYRDQNVILRVAGNGREPLEAYRKALGDDFTWTTRRLSGDEERYVLGLVNRSGKIAVDYTINVSRGGLIERVEAKRDGQPFITESHELVQAPEGHWFPAQLKTQYFGLGGRIDGRRDITVTNVEFGPLMDEASFRVEGAGVPPKVGIFREPVDGSASVWSMVNGEMVEQESVGQILMDNGGKSLGPVTPDVDNVYSSSPPKNDSSVRWVVSLALITLGIVMLIVVYRSGRGRLAH